MKRLFALALSLSLGLGNVFSVHADSAQDRLITAIQNTVDSPYIQIAGDASFQYGEKNILSESVVMQYSESALKANTKVHVDIDTSAFAAFKDIAAQSMTPETATSFFQTKVQVDAGAEVFYDRKTTDTYYTLLPFRSQVEPGSQDVKDILDGIFEFPKLVTNKSFHFNMETLSAELAKQDPVAGEALKAALQSMNKEDVATLYIALIESGLLEITNVSGNTFTLELIRDIKKLDVEALKSALEKLSFIPAEQKEAFLASFSEISAEDITSANEMLKKFHEFASFSLVVETNGTKITSYAVKALANSKKIAEALDLSFEPESLSIEGKAQFSYNTQDVAQNYDEAQTIHFDKIMKMIQTMEKQSQAAWQSAMEASESEDAASEAVSSGESSDDLKKWLADMPQDVWYKEHAQYLVKKGIITEPLDVHAFTTEQTLNMLSDRMNGYDASMWGSEKKVSKLDMVERLVQTITWSDIVPYAKEQKIVSEAFNADEAQWVPAKNAETIKVLALTVKAKEKQARTEQLRSKIPTE